MNRIEVINPLFFYFKNRYIWLLINIFYLILDLKKTYNFKK